MGATFTVPLRLGFGAASYWCKSSFPEADAIRIVHRAYEHGIRLFDTGSSYGDGRAEERLGKALLGRNEAIIATKAGTRRNVHGALEKDFSPSWVRESVEQSLRRLNREQLSLLQLHNPTIADLGEPLLALLETLKREGKTAHIGVSSFQPEVQRYVVSLSDRLDAIMVDFNLLKRDRAPVLEKAAGAGMFTMAGQCLTNGLLNTSLLRPSMRNTWYVLRALKNYRTRLFQLPRLSFLNQVEGWSATQLALAYVLHSSHVGSAIFNTTRMEHLDAVIDAATRPIPSDILQRIEAR